MKKKILILLCLIVAISFVGCKKDGAKDLFKEKTYINIEIENYGTISAELYNDVAPITVENFISLVKQGIFNGSSFHRIISGFMIQGGPKNDGSIPKIKGEFEANGIKNVLKHERGVISMARGNEYNSGSTQFFIVHKTNSSLDGRYAAFGRVTSGMEIVDEICEKTPVEDDNGTVLKENQPIITSIYIVEK